VRDETPPPLPPDPQVILISSGSEVALILAAQRKLEEQGIAAAAVSMPSHELFARQDEAYRDSVLPPGVPRVAIEAVLGIDRFGASAPYERIYEELGLSVDKLVAAARRLARR
jgi:transketolase